MLSVTLLCPKDSESDPFRKMRRSYAKCMGRIHMTSFSLVALFMTFLLVLFHDGTRCHFPLSISTGRLLSS